MTRSSLGVESATVAGLFAALSVVIVLRTRVVYDDPAILMRYAVNLAEGQGWTFNPPSAEDSNAVTSPLTVLALSSVLAIGFTQGQAEALLFGTSLWSLGFLTFDALRQLGHRLGGIWAAVLVMFCPALLLMRGMETHLFLALTALALGGAVRSSPWRLGIGVGLGVLARPDTLVLGALLICWHARANRLAAARATAVAATIVIPWLIISTWVTGGPVPSTLGAKIAHGRSGAWPGYLEALAETPLYTESVAWFLVMVPLAAVGLGGMMSWRTPLAAGLVAVVITAIAYGVILRVAGYPWYAALPVYFLCVAAGLGAERCVRDPDQARQRIKVAAATSVIATTVVVSAADLKPIDPVRLDYAEAGEWLRTETPTGSSVAAQEIGIVGLRSGRRVIDYLGLLDPAANSHVAAGDWTWWPRHYQPDYWVTYKHPSWERAREVWSEPWFADTFTVVHENGTLRIFARVAAVPRTDVPAAVD